MKRSSLRPGHKVKNEVSKRKATVVQVQGDGVQVKWRVGRKWQYRWWLLANVNSLTEKQCR